MSVILDVLAFQPRSNEGVLSTVSFIISFGFLGSLRSYCESYTFSAFSDYSDKSGAVFTE